MHRSLGTGAAYRTIVRRTTPITPAEHDYIMAKHVAGWSRNEIARGLFKSFGKDRTGSGVGKHIKLTLEKEAQQ